MDLHAHKLLCLLLMMTSGLVAMPVAAQEEANVPPAPRAMPEDVRAAFTHARRIELLALDPDRWRYGRCQRQCLDHWQIVQTRRLVVPAHINRVRDALARLVARAPDQIGICSSPRHAVRFIDPPRPFHLLIEAECGSLTVQYSERWEEVHFAVDREGELDRLVGLGRNGRRE